MIWIRGLLIDHWMTIGRVLHTVMTPEGEGEENAPKNRWTFHSYNTHHSRNASVNSCRVCGLIPGLLFFTIFGNNLKWYRTHLSTHMQ